MRRAYARRGDPSRNDWMTGSRHARLSSLRARAGIDAGEEGEMAVALKVRKWTLAEMHRLPEDGNKYELVRGELFVTPPAGEVHETIAARLSAILVPYV